MTEENMSMIDGASVRRAARVGQLRSFTSGLAPGYVQANLVVVPRDLAFDFLLFCQRNPQPCPLIDVTDPGCAEPKRAAAGADLRTDAPKYRIYRYGQLIEEVDHLRSHWRDDLVGFLLGCSFTFENALLQAGLPVRHIEQNTNVPMYRTSIPCSPAGIFHGPMVVSMRPMTREQAHAAATICARLPLAHGAPIQIGDPEKIGVLDLANPDYGEPVEFRSGEVPVFWACGVTPQAVAMKAKPRLLMTHAPGHMFLTDLRDEDLLDRARV
jgi:uncharacterized protein YcsI (UPF0317 family)